jgi:hypothetical protein
VEKRGREKQNEARVSGASRSPVFVAVRMACDRPSQMDDSQCFRPDVAQVGEEFHDPRPSLRSEYSARAGAGRLRFFGPKSRKNFEV